MRHRDPNLSENIQRRREVEQTLSQYPNLEPEKIRDVIHWFKREASAMDVAMVANNLDNRDSYREFRRTHIDKLTPVEIIVATVLMMILIVLLAAGAAAA
ncbi:hypothetical protein [Novosphingobium album (ex Liu et al. 2023)]|uniref:Uncharacterized protein n=1 Tax=Novosphingobium album (ex Liu et al. 2023) TaxID=3031130 RepID=A0ABT5WT96_9SPHN|nr:hypothetical protein [Novosphingobium album (ex Liu et al. 2023)]MDE8652782.1 hypothetical protein [Novosphingobium album (ex Liu et al. 2023)]